MKSLYRFPFVVFARNECWLVSASSFKLAYLGVGGEVWAVEAVRGSRAAADARPTAGSPRRSPTPDVHGFVEAQRGRDELSK